MVKVSKKFSSSRSAAKVVAGVPTPPVRSYAAEKDTKLRRSHEKKKKKIVKLEKKIVKLRNELDSHDAKRDALEARASEAENKLRHYTLKLENDTEVGADDPSIHYYQHFVQERRLPEDSKTLYATNIYNPEDRKFVQDDFVKFFSDVGKVVKVEIHLDPKCDDFVDFATVEFESHDVAKKAMEEKHSCCFYDCGSIKLDGLPKAEVPGYKRKDFTDERLVVYVTGFGKKPILGHKLLIKLTDYFSVCGVVDWITTPTDDYGYSTGHAFIEFKNEEHFKKALSLEGTLFLGSSLKVGRAKVREEKGKMLVGIDGPVY